MRSAYLICGAGFAVLVASTGCSSGSHHETVQAQSRTPFILIRYQVDEVPKLPFGLKTVAVLPEQNTSGPRDQAGSSQAQSGQEAWGQGGSGGGSSDQPAGSDVQMRACDFMTACLRDEIARQGSSLKVIDRTTFQQMLSERKLQISELSRPGAMQAYHPSSGADAIVWVKATASQTQTGFGRDVLTPQEALSCMFSPRIPRLKEKMGVQRSMAVQTAFRMDFVNGDVVNAQIAVDHATESAKPSRAFGRDQSVNDLSRPEPQIDAWLERHASLFVARTIGGETPAYPIYLDQLDENRCQEGLAALVRGDYAAARRSFEAVLAADPQQQDDETRFAAGVACEELGLLKTAERHYAAACAMRAKDEYRRALARVRMALRENWKVIREAEVG